MHPEAIRVRLRENASFFVADEAVADLTVLKKLPVVTWLPPSEITSGTPLGPLQLNAVADVPGEFSYMPAPDTVLSVSPPEVTPLTAMFTCRWIGIGAVRPDDRDHVYQGRLAPLMLRSTTHRSCTSIRCRHSRSVLSVSSMVKDHPCFTSATYVTSATESSNVGTYPVALESMGAANYAITLKTGVLTIVPRPTVTALQSSSTSPSTYGQAVSFRVGCRVPSACLGKR